MSLRGEQRGVERELPSRAEAVVRTDNLKRGGQGVNVMK